MKFKYSMQSSFLTYLILYIVGPREGKTFQKLRHLMGTKFLARTRKGDNLKRGVDAEMGGGGVTFLLFYSSITFTVCEGKEMFPLLLIGSSVF